MPDPQGSLWGFHLVGDIEVPRVPELARQADPATSHEAAALIATDLSALQTEVHAAFVRHGPASARQAEDWPELAYGFSTVRKRVSELAQMGLLIAEGTETESGRAKATVYRAVRLGASASP